MEKIKFEGLTIEELLSRTEDELDQLVFCNEALVFRVGSARILGRFKVDGMNLVLELAQIDGGGEGVLRAIAALSRHIARRRNLGGIEWLVHAVSCAVPNLKLRRILEKKGFEVRNVENVGDVYYLLQKV